MSQRYLKQIAKRRKLINHFDRWL